MGKEYYKLIDFYIEGLKNTGLIFEKLKKNE
jgi:hypothetical protein